MDLKKAAGRLYFLRFFLIYGTTALGIMAAIGARSEVFGPNSSSAEVVQNVMLGTFGACLGFVLGHLLNIPNDALRAVCVELDRRGPLPGDDG